MSTPAAVESYRKHFLDNASRWHGREPAWLSLLRREAFERFLDRGFPTTSEEDWRFTSVAPLAATTFSFAGTPSANGRAAALSRDRLPEAWKRHELVFLNGRFAEELSRVGELPERVVATSLSRALESHPDEVEAVLNVAPAEGSTAFSDLNRAFLSDGGFVFVPEGVALEAPIHLVFVTSAREPIVSHPHSVVLVDRGAEARVVESYVGTEGATYFTNAASGVVAVDGAVVDHYKLQRESDSAFHVGSHRFLQAKGSTVQDLSLSFGARLARNDIHSLLDGDGADLTLNGLYVVRGSQHVDHHTVIDHKEPRCTSRELYKGVLDDGSSGVFNGRIVVRRNAQKTNAQQTNKNLLLSEDALVNTNPQLEINADDVKCSHGATIGQLDKDALFYLRSRGIGLDSARAILTRAFIADVTERIRIGAVREAMRALVEAEAA
jgi:Fe-S cluster assembly protein SufD